MKSEIVDVCRRMHERGWIAATDGNVSVRLSPNRFLVTRSGIAKGTLGEDDVLEVDLDGRLLSAGDARPSSEWALHRAAYEERPDIGAVVHAHPPIAIALTLVGVSMEEPIIPEIVVTLGGIPTVPYATPTTAALAETARPYSARCDAFMLESHGAVCLGPTLGKAFGVLEKLEHTAVVIHAATAIAKPRTLSAAEVERLLAARTAMGLLGPNWLIDGPVDRDR